MLQTLTFTVIEQTLREFVREFLETLILAHPGKLAEWQEGWHALCETGQGGACLFELNIPEASKIQLIERLSHQYGKQFDDDLHFKRYIEKRLKLDSDMPHAASFGGEISLSDLFDACIKKLSHNKRMGLGLFDQSAEAGAEAGAQAGESDSVSPAKRSRND